MTYEEAKMQIEAIPRKIWDQLSEPDREAMEMAFSALEKQIPMKTLDPELGASPRRPIIIRCGNCGMTLAYSMREYCPRCGQAIDWEEE